MMVGTEFADRRTHYDVVIVGSGIVGLGHAYDAWQRGLTVAIVERSAAIAGASIRNFGHIGITGQSGQAAIFAEESRLRWRELAKLADFWISSAGALIVARAEDELELLREFHHERGHSAITMLSAQAVSDCSPALGVVGGGWLSRDLQVDPRSTANSIADWLAKEGVDFFWNTTVQSVETGVVHTARGDLRAGAVIVAVNADVDGLFPDIAARAELQRCSLEMLAVDAGLDRDLARPHLTGWSMVRYSGFAAMPSAATVRDRLGREHPQLLALDVNQMYTQRPNGMLLVGDTHTTADAASPFQQERGFESLLEITRELFGTPLRVRERWQGVYAKAPNEFLIETPAEGVRVVSVTTGIGMSTGLGLAASVMADLFGPLTHSIPLSEEIAS